MKVFLLCVFFTVASASVDKCPPGPTEEPVFLPNPADCTTYFQCVSGTPVLNNCPPGLEWAASLNRCDWPEIAKCVETETKPPTSPKPTGPTTPYPTECPEQDGDHDILLKNPEDCHSFFKCYHGTPVLVPCPEGQEWADHLKRCDWPEVAQCTVEHK